MTASKTLVLAASIALIALPAACTSVRQQAGPTPSATVSTTSKQDLEDEFISVVAKVSPSVVAIETPTGLGSGVIFDREGDIVTNAHVVADASSFTVFLANGRSLSAVLIGAFAPDDIAVLRVSTEALIPAQFADSDHLRVGAIVMAIGSPLGLQGSVTEGIVSAVGRQVTEPNGVALPPLIQTSASINPGNSGGALVDLDGTVVGITTLAAQDPNAGGTAPGIGFAVPSNIARDIASQLIKNGHVTNTHRAYLGIHAANAPNGSGAGVYAVSPGGPAEKAGLRVGDVITSLEGRPVRDQPSLASVLSALEPGKTVTLDVLRGQTRLSLTITLGELPG